VLAPGRFTLAGRAQAPHALALAGDLPGDLPGGSAPWMSRGTLLRTQYRLRCKRRYEYLCAWPASIFSCGPHDTRSGRIGVLCIRLTWDIGNIYGQEMADGNQAATRADSGPPLGPVPRTACHGRGFHQGPHGRCVGAVTRDGARYPTRWSAGARPGRSRGT
jgi:hypothetical protein